MLSRGLVLGACALSLALALSACSAGGDDPASRAADLCERADQCNALSGYSVDECTDLFDRCVESLPDDEQHDWAHSIDDCLAYDSCTSFVDCLGQVQAC